MMSIRKLLEKFYAVISLEESKSELLESIETYGIVKHRLRMCGVFLCNSSSIPNANGKGWTQTISLENVNQYGQGGWFSLPDWCN